MESALSIGQHLRKERELRGIEIDEVSKVTRVRVAYLQHLEDDQLTELPADVYTRGYIRAYARFLGIDAERCIELYWAQAPDRRLAPVMALAGNPGEVTARSLPVLSEGGTEPAAAVTGGVTRGMTGGVTRGMTGGMNRGNAPTSGRSRIGLALVIVVLFCAALLMAGVYYVNRSDDPGTDPKNKPSTTQSEKDRFFVDG
jgi:hypothetical protein